MNFDVSKWVPVIKAALPYAKTAAVATAAVVTTLVCVVDGNVSQTDLAVIGTAWAGVYGVWRVPNKK